MSVNRNLAIQASVATALISTTLALIPASILAFVLSGEWLRAQRTLILAVFMVPLTLFLRRRLRQGHIRETLLCMSLASWLGLSAQLFTSGTLVNPVLPMLLSVSAVGSLAQDHLLRWLMPLLCVGSTVSLAILEHFELLPHNMPPNGLIFVIGCLLATGLLAMMTQISSSHLARSHQLERENNQRLQQLSAQLQLAMQAGQIHCFSLDPRSRSLLLDDASSHLLHCPPGMQTLDQLAALSPSDQQRIAQAAEQTQHGESFPSLDCQLQSGPAQGRWFRLLAAPDLDQPPQLICALQDIDEQKQVEKNKEHFISMVSHELRTPLTALLGSLRLIEGLHLNNLSIDVQTLLQMAIRGGDRLAFLVNDILDFAKLQSGRMSMHCQPQPLQPILDKALDSVHSLLQERDLHVQQRLPADTGTAYLDSQRGQQVLINLLSNAIKFSPPGSALWIEVEPSAEHIRINVRDSGPGIAEDFRAHIFEPFTQANMSNTRDSNSTGLGLAISRELMREMGGELSYSSPPGCGATFHVDFLRHAPERPSSTN